MLFYDWTFLLLIPALIFGAVAQAKVKSAYSKYSKIRTRSGITAADMVRNLLNYGAPGTRIERVSGTLSDHFDPREHVIRLSDGVYDASSIAALGVAAHEAGHAMQYNDSYFPIKLRNAILPVAQVGSWAAFPIVIIGLLFGYADLAYIGVIVYAAVVVFQLITLPVEYNASSRAIQALADGNYLDADELDGARKVLSAAALTYVAATLAAVLSLLRLLLIARSSRR